MFIEPLMGLGYPVDTLPFLSRLEKYYKQGDDKLLATNVDFIGVQYYFRIVARHSVIPPLHASQIKPEKRNVEINSMGLEVYPNGIIQILEKFSRYKNVKKIYITEGGICFDDIINPDGTISDIQRTNYFKVTLEQVLNAKNKGIPVEGYFVWSLTDNFEWNYGYSPRFGLVYIDYPTQKRILKNSGKWFSDFLGR
jgi:beta-glucosidase